MTVLSIAAGVASAVAAAACFGTSAVLQYRATHQVPSRPAGRPALLLDLVRRPAWRWSILLAIAGFGLQVLALRLAPLILVQPLLVTGVLWFVLVAARVYRRRPDRLSVAGTVLCLAGLTAFLALARPTPSTGDGLDRLSTVLPLVVGLAVILTACLALAGSVHPPWRALPLSVAAGVCYGVTAGLVSSLSSDFTEGIPGVFEHWQACAVCVLGPVGVLLSQNSYQAGRIGAPALTIITVTDPLVSIGIGTLWLGEKLHTGAAPVTGEVLALVVLVGGVLLLARSAPHVARIGVPPDLQRPESMRAGQVRDAR